MSDYSPVGLTQNYSCILFSNRRYRSFHFSQLMSVVLFNINVPNPFSSLMWTSPFFSTTYFIVSSGECLLYQQYRELVMSGTARTEKVGYFISFSINNNPLVFGLFSNIFSLFDYIPANTSSVSSSLKCETDPHPPRLATTCLSSWDVWAHDPRAVFTAPRSHCVENIVWICPFS